jgi:lantibiotic leader peptide-processing serine protease
MRKRVVCGLVLAAAAVFAPAALASNYVVLYKQQAVPADVAATVAKAGGSLVYAYPEIGVAIASSDNPAFRDNLLKDNRIENAASTQGFASQLPDLQADADSSGGDLPNAPAADADTFSALQWDMRQIHTPEAHAITGGSPAVLVGDIDTGLDFRHPDLRANIDSANSVNCVSGAPVPGAVAANDDNGHGTHTAGTIAASANGIGIVGVAPNVRIAGIKAGNAAGFFFPEAVICAFVWAGTHHFDVTNNSYFADPYLYNCKNDPVQRAIWKAEQRAIRFALQNGVTVVAAEGNEADDVAHPTTDRTSPDNSTPVVRTIHNDCVVIPLEVSGVIGVTATGHNRQLDSNGQPDGFLKSYYSSFGVGVTQLTAPGGDNLFGVNAEAMNGRVLSTWPPDRGCGRSVKETGDVQEPTAVYCYLQGTSMASPHVAGVAALIVSRYGNLDNPQNGKMSPDRVKAYLDQTADPQGCPGILPTVPRAYSGILGTNSGAVQSCQGGTGYNSWYGNGQVNAFNAVTHTAGN